MSTKRFKIALAAAAPVVVITAMAFATGSMDGSAHPSARGAASGRSSASQAPTQTARSSRLPTTTWTPTRRQLVAAETTMIMVAAGADPAVPASDAEAVADAATTWPANVTKVEVLATDRASAEAGMGTPGAVNGASGNVLFFQLTGQFVGRGYPSPQGAPPPRVVTYVHCVIDPTASKALDFGVDPYAAVWDTAAVQMVFGS